MSNDVSNPLKAYRNFRLESGLTEEAKVFFNRYGFLHFKNFVSRETVSLFIAEMKKIEKEWIEKDVKVVNGVPIKYGTDINNEKTVQRFAFANQYSKVLSEFLKDTRLRALFELIGNAECRIGENEKDGLVINHYVNIKESNYSRLGWHTDSLRDIFYGHKIMPMLNVGLHLDDFLSENGGLRLIPGTHTKGLMNTLFGKPYYISHKPDKNEVGMNIDAGDLTVHDGRLWHRVAKSKLYGEASRRRVMYLPIITGKYTPRNHESKTPLYHKLAHITNK